MALSKDIRPGLVAKGFTQVQGIDYIDIFPPVVKLNSIKLILGLVAQYNLEAHQLDVKTAFLNGFLDEDVYMSVPEGLPKHMNPKSNLICKLLTLEEI